MGSRLFAILAYFCAALAGSTQALAETFTLFSAPGVQVPDYDLIVERLQPDDRIRFSDGEEFALRKRLDGDRGSTTLIWEIAESGPGGKTQAIRIPKRAGVFPRTGKPYAEYIDFTIQGHLGLRAAKAPSVEVFGHRAGEFVRVEKLEEPIEFDEYLRLLVRETASKDPSLAALKPNEMTWDLLKFARETAVLESISDLHPMQLAYVRGRGWVIMDWSATITPATRESHSNVFWYFPRILSRDPDQSAYFRWLEVYDRLLKPAITEERRKHFGRGLFGCVMGQLSEALNRGIERLNERHRRRPR